VLDHQPSLHGDWQQEQARMSVGLFIMPAVLEATATWPAVLEATEVAQLVESTLAQLERPTPVAVDPHLTLEDPESSLSGT
jgi:hypothetical protein